MESDIKSDMESVMEGSMLDSLESGMGWYGG